ncbi:hypothetical protein JKP88DRAFT_347825 [Tribonema minus]|uniref:HMG box domain-containing protein n=1 Tax=Tribonema minus TaxID=303371 RepID=A0A836CK92_9STRA|nr:hypothetical protein JKP88DRAFT_347825 [Tribonema minus]
MLDDLEALEDSQQHSQLSSGTKRKLDDYQSVNAETPADEHEETGQEENEQQEDTQEQQQTNGSHADDDGDDREDEAAPASDAEGEEEEADADGGDPHETGDDPAADADEEAEAGTDGEAGDGEAEAEAEEDSAAASEPAKKIKRAQSAWMFFLADKRDEVVKANPGARIGAVVKECSGIWAAMPPEEKQVYEAQAAEDKARLQRELQAAGLTKLPSAGNRSGEERDLPPDATTTILLPLSRVRKTAKMDAEVKSINADGLATIAKATELFIATLAKRSWGAARQSGRRNLRVTDIAQCVDADGALYFLREELATMAAASSRKAAAAPPAKKAALAAGPGSKSITSFFART